MQARRRKAAVSPLLRPESGTKTRSGPNRSRAPSRYAHSSGSEAGSRFFTPNNGGEKGGGKVAGSTFHFKIAGPADAPENITHHSSFIIHHSSLQNGRHCGRFGECTLCNPNATTPCVRKGASGPCPPLRVPMLFSPNLVCEGGTATRAQFTLRGKGLLSSFSQKHPRAITHLNTSEHDYSLPEVLGGGAGVRAPSLTDGGLLRPGEHEGRRGVQYICARF